MVLAGPFHCAAPRAEMSQRHQLSRPQKGLEPVCCHSVTGEGAGAGAALVPGGGANYSLPCPVLA